MHVKWFLGLLLSFIGVANAAQLTFSVSSINFGVRPINTDSAESDITISNFDTTTANISQMTIVLQNPASSFTVTANTCHTTQAAGSVCTVGIKMNGSTTTGDRTAIFQVVNDGVTTQIPLSGNISSTAIPQMQQLMGKVAYPLGGAGPFTGRLALQLAAKSAFNLCTNPASVVTRSVINVSIANSQVIGNYGIIPNNCLSPSYPYFVQIYDNNNALVAQENWYLGQAMGNTIDIGTMFLTDFGGPIVLQVPNPILGSSNISQVINQPTGANFSFNTPVVFNQPVTFGAAMSMNLTNSQFQGAITNSIINGTSIGTTTQAQADFTSVDSTSYVTAWQQGLLQEISLGMRNNYNNPGSRIVWNQTSAPAQGRTQFVNNHGTYTGGLNGGFEWLDVGPSQGATLPPNAALMYLWPSSIPGTNTGELAVGEVAAQGFIHVGGTNSTMDSDQSQGLFMDWNIGPPGTPGQFGGSVFMNRKGAGTGGFQFWNNFNTTGLGTLIDAFDENGTLHLVPAGSGIMGVQGLNGQGLWDDGPTPFPGGWNFSIGSASNFGWRFWKGGPGNGQPIAQLSPSGNLSIAGVLTTGGGGVSTSTWQIKNGVAMCTPPNSTDGSCTGSINFSTWPGGFAYPDNGYSVTTQLYAGSGAFVNAVVTGKSNSVVNYIISCSYNCSNVGAIYADVFIFHP